MQFVELVKRIRYPEENTLNISCWNTSQIQIQKIDVQVEETTCGQNQCVLNSNDTQTIEDNCNGENSCLVEYNFTSACLREFRYVNLSYTCKHENGTNISTFEDDFGDWNGTYSNSFTWYRTNVVTDHTMIAGVGSKGHSLSAPSYSGKAGTERIDTNNAFMEPICLTFWYQFYRNAYDCIFSIYRITDENQTLIFTVDGNSTSFNTWINKSVDVYGQYPFKIAFEADFKHRHSIASRFILIDDTSIAYRPCQGQVHSACHEMKKTIEIECETQHLVGNIELFLKPKNPTSHQINCPAESIKNQINSFCRNVNMMDKCKLSVLNFTSGYKDCYVSSKNISVSYQCNNNFQTTILKGISTEPSSVFEAIAAGVGGGVLLIIIVVVVIYRVRRSKTGKQETSPGNANKAYDENQYDYASQQHLNSSESSNQNTNKQNKSNLNTQKQVLIGQDGQQSADLYSMTENGTYDISSNNKPRENQNDNNVYSHMSSDGTYDVSSNSKHRENPNDNNLYNHWSGDGTYDVSSNNKKRENQIDDNIYSHKADDVYDSAGHHKLPDRSEETYDHFFGQQTEDEYDTTTRT
ncbi:Hypothetical predicted protein [Mytilus galloprovincialis]|uniref:MAM domain-containing protein n=1 Tax=Mytilus galloprovincialis TaxID=29158 RepID=A0A8B6D2G6_MYTGA|nr:Hypothetical predicted protein [Mytilus galloprovincialis]